MSNDTPRGPVREESHPVVIIGAGVGGSVAAFRLADAGVDNLVLERGRRWPITPDGDTFPTVPYPDKRIIWLDDKPPTPVCDQVPWLARITESITAAALPRSTGLLDVLPHKNLTVVCGAGVGGGTLVYGGILPQPKAGPFREVFPPEVDYEEMDRVHYPRARRRLGAADFPDDVLAHRRYRSNRVFGSAVEKAGLPVERVPSTFDFDIIRAELDGRAKPSATVGQYFFTGCDSGAKLSVDRTYLARAEATGRTEVRPLHKVTAIAQDADGRYRVSAERLGVDGDVLERIDVLCARLILAAGGVHTPRMLVTARDTGALPLLNEHVGEQWGTNADQLPLIRTIAVATGSRQGGPPTFLTRNADGSALLTQGGQPVPVETGLLLCPGVGMSDRFGRWTYSAATEHAHLRWASGSDTTGRRAITELLHLVARHIPLGGVGLNPLAPHPLVLHPLGGAVIGKATDAYGRLHGHDGLYCLDSALMPGSTAAVNPVLTIAAVVERCLDHVIGDFTS
ncbi:GMC oxidoreductase [Streptomyces specialis]|uniref:GMC oxidoreductase n=1 Tax=Streptomyces specialis TaxID=498367 RepID=UPI00073E90A5|nr:GMC oxidoreductase [Streptomyces specialis]